MAANSVAPGITAFLSYSSLDADLARRIATDLRSQGISVWLDQWELVVGTEFSHSIEQGVDDAEFLIVLLTPNSVESDWVEREWRRKQMFEDEKQGIAVIPVRGAPCEIPDFLAQRSHADVSGGSYPLGLAHLLDLLHHYSGRTTPRDDDEPQPTALDDLVLTNIVTPIALEVSGDLIPLFEGGGTSRAMSELIPAMRAGIERDLGFWVPGVRVRGNETDMPPGTALVMLDELPELMLTVPRDVDAAAFLCAALDGAIREGAASFMDPDGARRLIEAGGASAIELAKEIIPGIISWFQLTDVLRRLLDEAVSVGDIARILRELAIHGSTERDTVALTEHVRHALCDRITSTQADGRGAVVVLTLGPTAESLLSASIQRTSVGSYLALEPETTQTILAAVRAQFDTPLAGAPVAILTTPSIRRYVRRLVELEFPDLAVLSREDLQQSATIVSIATIDVDRST